VADFIQSFWVCFVMCLEVYARVKSY